MQRQIDISIAELNRLVQEHGIAHVQERIAAYQDAAQKAVIQDQGATARREFAKTNHVETGDMILHRLDTVMGGHPDRLAGTGLGRANTAIGSNHDRLAWQIAGLDPSGNYWFTSTLVVV